MYSACLYLFVAFVLALLILFLWISVYLSSGVLLWIVWYSLSLWRKTSDCVHHILSWPLLYRQPRVNVFANNLYSTGLFNCCSIPLIIHRWSWLVKSVCSLLCCCEVTVKTLPSCLLAQARWPSLLHSPTWANLPKTSSTRAMVSALAYTLAIILLFHYISLGRSCVHTWLAVYFCCRLQFYSHAVQHKDAGCLSILSL